jgi:hypothetical protein
MKMLQASLWVAVAMALSGPMRPAMAQDTSVLRAALPHD